MPIRFRCKSCRQLLGIATRKAGTEISCPKCGTAQIVPQPGQAEAATSATQPSGAANGSDSGSNLGGNSGSTTEGLSQIVVYDEPATGALELRATAAPSDQPASWPSDHAGGAAGQAPVPGQPLPSNMILFRRSTLYLQAALLAAVAVGAFGAGFVIGRGEMRYRAAAEGAQAAMQRVVVRGKLSYRATALEIRPDANAVVIAFPVGQYPPKPLSAEGLRPRDPIVDTNRTIDAIRKLGGDYARADASGDFTLDVAGQGRYHLLMISAHAVRDPNTPIDEADLESLRRCFHVPDELIGRYQYIWESHTLQIGMNPIEKVFGHSAGP